MKVLMSALVVVIVLAGVAVPAGAAARYSARSADSESAAQQGEQQICREEAFERDPSGLYAGYPCWARQAFSPRR